MWILLYFSGLSCWELTVLWGKMADFDDLLNLGGDTSQSNQGSSDPFDPFGSGQSANQNEGNNGGALLDLGFTAQVCGDFIFSFYFLFSAD